MKCLPLLLCFLLVLVDHVSADHLCVPGKNKCDTASSKCVTTTDNAGYVCECLEGYERQAGTVDKCVDIDECASDPAYVETMKKVAAGQNKSSWKKWMVVPKDKASGYGVCYYNALNNVSFNSMQRDIPLADTLLPMCSNLNPNQDSNQTSFDPRIKGFECTCQDPKARTVINLMKRFAFSCPSPGCPNCRTDLNYECVDKKCRCKHGYSQRVINNIMQCINRECGPGEEHHPQLIASGHVMNVKCDDTYRYVAMPGFRLVRDNVTRNVIDAVDINECAQQPDICCADESRCTGPRCIKCFNTIGSYTCQSDGIVYDISSVDKNTCKGKALLCSKQTAWYADCSGNPTLKNLDKGKRVCSRIFDQNTNKFKSFVNEQALFDYSVKLKCDCCFLSKKPSSFSANPVVNYYGSCLDKAEKVVCPDGAKAKMINAGPWCPIKAKLSDLPSMRAGDEMGHSAADFTMCQPLPAVALFMPKNGKMELMAL